MRLLVHLSCVAFGRHQVQWALQVYEFMDNDQFSNLETLLLQLAPGQCLLSLDADAIKGKPRGEMAKVTLKPSIERGIYGDWVKRL